MSVLELTRERAETKKQLSAISIRNVLYATDFSEPSESAFPYATAICRKFGSALHVAHVLDDTSMLFLTGGVDYVSVETLYNDAHVAAQEKVKEITKRAGEIPNRAHLRHGQVWANLGGIVAENAIDLIVVGTHGRTGLGKLLLGSVAEDILRHAPCLVLTVGPRVCGRSKLPEFNGGRKALTPPELDVRQIVCATNFAPGSAGVGPLAIALAQEFEARLTLMHVLEDYSKLEERPGPIEFGVARLQALAPKTGLSYVPEIVMDFGSPWQCIVNKAAERDADLIVLGAHALDGSNHLPWSTVHQVIAHATCPVLTIRS